MQRLGAKRLGANSGLGAKTLIHSGAALGAKALDYGVVASSFLAPEMTAGLALAKRVANGLEKVTR
jgi:hypothetical protein